MATPMTAGQLERFAQAHRRVSEADRDRPRPARRLTWGPAGDLDYQIRAVLPAEAAAVVFQALRAARNDLEHPHDEHHDHDHDSFPRKRGSSALAPPGHQDRTTSPAAQPRPPAEMEPTQNLADALVQVCADSWRPGRDRRQPDTYQVIIRD